MDVKTTSCAYWERTTKRVRNGLVDPYFSKIPSSQYGCTFLFFFVKHHSLKMFFTTRVENYRMKKALLERRRYSHSTINCRPLQQKPLSENVQIIFVVDWLKKQQNKNNGYKFFSNLAHERLFDGYKIFILPFTFRLLLLIYVLVPTLVRTTVLV